MSKYSQFRALALNNDHEYHVVAIVRRRGKLIGAFANERRYKNRYFRHYTKSTRPGEAMCAHAEMRALEVAKRGDLIEVMRFRKDGTIAIAKPCAHCEKRLKNVGVRVKYTDEDGNWRSLLDVPGLLRLA